MKHFIRGPKGHEDEAGQDLVEYGLLLMLIAIFAIGIVGVAEIGFTFFGNPLPALRSSMGDFTPDGQATGFLIALACVTLIILRLVGGPRILQGLRHDWKKRRR